MSQFTKWQDFQKPASTQRASQVDELRLRVHGKVIEVLGPLLEEGRLSDRDLRRTVADTIHSALSEEALVLSGTERAELVREITDDALGYGPIDRFIKDPTITEVMCNGPHDVYLERDGKIERTNVRFNDEAHLRRIIERIVSEVGRRVDESTPMVDARLPDGSRVNAVVHPVAIGGPFLTIRKFSKVPFQVGDLINFGTCTAAVAHFLDACVRGRLNCIISGGTGSGKTTLLNVLSSFVPPDERVVTIEDAKELRLQQDHVLSLEARPPNIEGTGAVGIRDLVRNALRMRPDRVIVGECRGPEALDMLQAMNTGHDGSLTTTHCNSPRDAISRIETMVLMAGMDMPVRAIREQVASALDLIVHVSRLRDGTRRITHVTEVLGMETDTIILQDVYLFDYGMGVDADGRFLGHLKSTGIRPRFTDRLADHGIRLEPELFTLEPFARRAAGVR
jgi:pilus assembly protein CpaF